MRALRNQAAPSLTLQEVSTVTAKVDTSTRLASASVLRQALGFMIRNGTSTMPPSTSSVCAAMPMCAWESNRETESPALVQPCAADNPAMPEPITATDIVIVCRDQRCPVVAHDSRSVSRNRF
jgi:hypothetical protein